MTAKTATATETATATGQGDAGPGRSVELDDITVTFSTERGEVTALRDISLSVDSGGFVSLLGPSGCGKSTLLRVVADLLKPTTGTVSVLGTSAHEARVSRQLGFVFQDAALLPWRTALENVRLPLQVGGGAKAAASDGQDAASPEELLALVGLAGREHAYPHELSGGMRQRVSIARALVCRPRVLLMDEPFGALDEITRDRLNEELLRIWEATGTTILFVTHSIAEAVFMSQQVLVLSSHPGRVRELVPVDLPSPRRLDVRDTPEFTALAARLRRLLEDC
ncbi:ABC transporter ATP-binding protein [Streptomyces sp. HC44]|uniref:ABC transporter ATP-binding protein n=1 Tax=Streptomyces scabichelini TaxID=2711217 RepID=A0A6G4VCQ4_9ACTN|nr:ABC transporter ATP-binding protein [Streptomyces scabichelini]NGO11597.1 ABC transporter ATP-binding protein [Streptomyces scabichelini]